MIEVSNLSSILLVLLFSIILTFFLLDFFKKRKLSSYQKVSFIIPCYNGASTIKETLKGIYNSYPKKYFEIIIINDNSKDNTLQVLKKLKKEFSFRLINNYTNLGKAKSINSVYNLAKNDLLWIVDSDCTLNKKSVEDVLKRFESNKNVAAAGCPYKIRQTSFFWSKMQWMEYNMASLVLTATSFFTAVSLWGGCLAVKKSAFKKVGGFSENMLTEDIDLSFKINKLGLKVSHSPYAIFTYGKDNFHDWFYQKKRWIAGMIQCYLVHFKTLIKHPIQPAILILSAICGILIAISIYKDLELCFLSLNIGFIAFALSLGNFLIIKILLSVFSIPYTLPMIKNLKDSYKILYSIPFSLIYLPMFVVLSIFWGIKGVWIFLTIKQKDRAW